MVFQNTAGYLTAFFLHEKEVQSFQMESLSPEPAFSLCVSYISNLTPLYNRKTCIEERLG